jgi:hypothetical protein
MAFQSAIAAALNPIRPSCYAEATGRRRRSRDAPRNANFKQGTIDDPTLSLPMRYPDAPDDLNSTVRPATFGAKPFEGTTEDSVSVREI